MMIQTGKIAFGGTSGLREVGIMERRFSTSENDETNSGPDQLLDEALDWIVRLEAGESFAADVEALQFWRSQSPRHELAFRKAVRLWRLLGVAARELGDERTGSIALATPATPVLRRGVGHRQFIGSTIAASAAAFMVTNPSLELPASLSQLSSDYATGKGEQRSVVLSDDISVQMNTQTSISVRSVPSAIEIVLISGEAAIVKLGRLRKPVKVVAAQGQMIASRANFNVRYIDDVVAVTCIDGVVDIARDQNIAHLPAEHQVSYSSAGLSESVLAEPDDATAWQLGVLIFHDKPLSKVIDEVNRYRPGRIVITNAELGRRVVSGMFYVDRLNGFVGDVQQLFDVQVRSLPFGFALLS